MAKIAIIVEGYAREENGIEFASATTTLIRAGAINPVRNLPTSLIFSQQSENSNHTLESTTSQQADEVWGADSLPAANCRGKNPKEESKENISNGINIIVDPGMDRAALLAGLEREKLTPEQIQFVIQTHTHNDHSLLAGIFGNAEIIDNDAVYSWNGKIIPHAGKIPGTEVEIVPTPGHDPFHCSVLVPIEDLGRVVIAGDVIWWYASEEQKTDRANILEHTDPYVKDPVALRASREKILALADYIIPGHGKMFRVEK